MTLEFKPYISISILRKHDQIIDSNIRQLFVNELAHVFFISPDKYCTENVKDNLTFEQCENIIDTFCQQHNVKLQYIIIEHFKTYHRRTYTNKQFTKMHHKRATKFIRF
jgi:hypothetical protein